MAETYYCEKCNRTMDGSQFYGSNNLEKYPVDGKLHQCKKCITMHVDNWNPDTFLWILQECDVPFVPDEWNKLLEKYAREPEKLTSMTILGRYLSKMKLKQFKDYRWKDNEFLQQLASNKIEQAMKRQGYEAADIAQAISRATVEIPEGQLTQPVYAPSADAPNPYSQLPGESYFDSQFGGDNEFVDELTDEDKIHLKLKWGKTYKPEEWIRLEQLYEEMMRSYDIQGAAHIDTLKLICKTSLKANQLIDIGDIEGFQKVSKVYDQLMKSGKFTAAQNRADQNEGIDSIGELVALCEKEGFIPKYYVDTPKDKVDRVVEDLQKYTKDLIEGESGLSTMVENAIKQIEEENERIREAANHDEEDDEDQLFNYDGEIISDQDFIDFNEFQQELEDEDAEFFEMMNEE